MKTYLFAIFLICWNLLFSQAESPNFILIILDDQGWTGTSVEMDPSMSVSSSDYYHTPEIAALADMGMVFSQAYAPAPKCAPSRASILTGRSTSRNGFTSTDNNIATGEILIEGTTETTIDANSTTYAEWLKSTNLNYRTAHFGKWHLGSQTEHDPSNHGFDQSDGTTNNSDGNSGVIANEDPKKIFDLTERSIAFISQAVADGVPFALQLSHYAVHGDIEYRQQTLDLYNTASERPPGTRHDNAEYGAMTEDTDTGIGLLMAELQELDILDNTYVFFMSDNGGQLNFTDNTPLAFGKTFIYEGGIRVPFIAVGPGISPGSYSSEAIVGYDLFPTMAELSGSTQELPDNLDGQSIATILTGNAFERQEYIFFHSPHYDNNPNKTPRSAIVDNEFKLIVEYETGDIELFNLNDDIGESTDLSDQMPSYALELRILLRDHLEITGVEMPSLDPAHASFSGSGDDVDNDGLSDSWEFRKLLTYTEGPEDDPDGDGFSNLQELENGTDPLFSSSETGEEALYVHLVNNDITVYPNPVNNYLKIDSHFAIEQVFIYDLNGRILSNIKRPQEVISLAGYAPGKYFVQVEIAGNKNYTKQIVIK